VEGNNTLRIAPDVMVAFGRPKGYRGSYRQWQEGGVAPQVVFEVLSPGNTIPELLRKLHFYERHGVEECYYLDPEKGDATGWRRPAAPGVGDELVGLLKVDQGGPDDGGRKGVVVRLGEELLLAACEPGLLLALVGDANRHHVSSRNSRLLRLDALIPRPDGPLL